MMPRALAVLILVALMAVPGQAWATHRHALPLQPRTTAPTSEPAAPSTETNDDEPGEDGLWSNLQRTFGLTEFKPAPPDDPSSAEDDTRTKGDAAPTTTPLLMGSARRFALIVGANDGGAARAELRYAQSDAATLAKVLHELGGIPLSDIMRLDDPTPEALARAFERMRTSVDTATATGPVQFIFYYSGHSDERALLLGEREVNYRDLRRMVDDVPADVRIAILDSCASGAFTRLKGGTKQAPFLVAPVSDVKGHAFLTSSSVDESAQESERIGGSFFTHYLATGLRGAADRNRDKLITLGEAYEFAFDETLERTEATRGGPQHAAYDIQLSGTGDLVMTDLRSFTGRLELSEDLGGRVSVREQRGGNLAAELYKPKGAGAVLLALEPGSYQVTIDDGSQLWRADVTVPKSGQANLDPADLRKIDREAVVTRGDDDGLRYIPFSFGLVPRLSINQKAKGEPVRNSGNISILYSRVARIDGVAVAFGVTIVEQQVSGVQMAMLGNINRGLHHGAQLGFVFNKVGEINGGQVGFINIADKIRAGAQFGFVNRARGMRGVQFGVVNTIRDTDVAAPEQDPEAVRPDKRPLGKGAQVGVVNTAGRMRGVQIGLINAAADADAQIGLISATREGNVHPEVYTSDTAPINIAFRLPARHTYTLLGVGLSIDPLVWQLGAGLGGHIRLAKNTFIDVDLSAWAISNSVSFEGPWGTLHKLRVMFGWAPYKRLSVFIGPTLNVMLDRLGTTRDTVRPGYGWVSYERTFKTDGTLRMRIWPGFVGGLRF